MFCPHCGKSVPDAAGNCPECGQPLVSDQSPAQAAQPDVSPKSRLAVTLFSFFLGGFGIHRFYAGRAVSGLCMLALCLLGIIGSFFVIGVIFLIPLSIWALVDFILAVAGCFKDGNGRIIKNW